MNKFKHILGAALSVLLSVSILTGCASQDKKAINDTAYNFITQVATESKENISQYASDEVVKGEFVELFDSEALAGKFVNNSSETELSEEAKNKLDEFCKLFSGMIKTYSISNIKLTDKKNATAVATIKTSFPIDIINSENASAKIDEAIKAYNESHAEEIAALYEQGKDVAQSKIYNDMIITILEIYEDEIENSQEITYAIVLTLNKNDETGKWIVTDVQDYDSSNK